LIRRRRVYSTERRSEDVERLKREEGKKKVGMDVVKELLI
jgi:hypothetical protein